jgi:hypothetical protein
MKLIEMFNLGMITQIELFTRLRETKQTEQLSEWKLLLEAYKHWDKNHPEDKCITFYAGAFVR